MKVYTKVTAYFKIKVKAKWNKNNNNNRKSIIKTI